MNKPRQDFLAGLFCFRESARMLFPSGTSAHVSEHRGRGFWCGAPVRLINVIGWVWPGGVAGSASGRVSREVGVLDGAVGQV